MEEKIVQEFKQLVAQLFQIKEELDAKFVAQGYMDVLAMDRQGQRGPSLFDR